jgi:hypothetical protein
MVIAIGIGAGEGGVVKQCGRLRKSSGGWMRQAAALKVENKEVALSSSRMRT